MGVVDNEQGWKRLATAVKQRREERGWTQLEVATRGPLSIDRIQSIEGARTDRYSGRTLSALERGLEWESGSVRDVLAGGEPTPKERTQAPPPPVAEGDDDILTSEERRLVDGIRRDPRKRRFLVDAILAGHGQNPDTVLSDDDKTADRDVS